MKIFYLKINLFVTQKINSSTRRGRGGGGGCFVQMAPPTTQMGISIDLLLLCRNYSIFLSISFVFFFIVCAKFGDEKTMKAIQFD